ncbi:Ebp2-domain-containing protein [Terfezia boudieri ATCC MYA-4762]|uniref:Ebp2-domain-containing protein n=1 Tax=Terfezia boudieri ATCC MYA-4762 TaxID=1051890 RepID=A0A3N4M8A8_9PEZI|nr:Ebp2-domain-containing protein [Terfezia boudieri ATCC MYA-4762]
MVTKSKLKIALDAEQGRDYAKEKQAKLRKKAEKEKRQKGIVDGVRKLEVNGKKFKKGEEEKEEEDEEEDIPQLVDADAARQYVSSDEFESGLEETESQIPDENENEDGEKEDDEEYSDVDLSDIENEDDLTVPDVIPHQRLTINNTSALTAAYNRISLPLNTLPFSEHLSHTSTTSAPIHDIHNDLNRELAFYSQALTAVKEARLLLHKEGVPFSRPNDYFAEMLKTDDHMGKIRQKLVDEAADKKAVQDARKQRDLRKFGKQVQVAKLQDREKQKKETLEKINALKRKRASGDTALTNDSEDLFDIALEQASNPNSKDRRRSNPTGAPNAKRQKKNEKFGFGGKKRHTKSNDAQSSGDISGFSNRANKARGFGAGAKKGMKKRPGKSVRAGRRV